MSIFRFPFNWGAVPDAVPVIPPVVIPASGTRWSVPALGGKAWIEGAPVVAAHRFEHIYTQPKAVFGQSINFVYQVQSQFPFLVATGTNVIITSTITTP